MPERKTELTTCTYICSRCENRTTAGKDQCPEKCEVCGGESFRTITGELEQPGNQKKK